jgi:ribA/ribD-fused uncharacterized protein
MKRCDKRPARQNATALSQSALGKEAGPLFFYLPFEKYGELCQWYSSPFTVSTSEIAAIIGTNHVSSTAKTMAFTCAEQFMMYCKAGRFNDTATQAKIMATDSPKEQKRLGRLTTGFNDKGWDEVKSEVVVAGNMAKFGQSDKLRGKLLATGERLLVEASGRDRVWGIGYTAKHAMQHREHWGENLLGLALMEVRRRLREEGGGCKESIAEPNYGT